MGGKITISGMDMIDKNEKTMISAMQMAMRSDASKSAWHRTVGTLFLLRERSCCEAARDFHIPVYCHWQLRTRGSIVLKSGVGTDLILCCGRQTVLAALFGENERMTLPLGFIETIASSHMLICLAIVRVLFVGKNCPIWPVRWAAVWASSRRARKRATNWRMIKSGRLSKILRKKSPSRSRDRRRKYVLGTGN